ncbi:Ferric siderophore transport system, periplasmic binding protein TonB [Minicystis rosea]|nr:Ferric siderophore transport system, periplasmic binding protein TonB [Minicystis rosea]
MSTGSVMHSRDPLALMLGEVQRPRPFYASSGVALTLHVAVLAFAIAGAWLKDIRLAIEDNRAKLHEFFWRQYDVDLTPKDKPKEEEKAPEPPPEPDPAPPPPAPKAVAPAPKDDDPYKNLPPPTPAKAAAVLTQKEDPDAPKDLTDNTVVSGDGSATYGKVSAAGTGDKPVLAPNASLSGVPGGKGTGTAAPAAPEVDRSRAVGLVGGATWNCPFPPEADAEQIDQAVVTVQVTVRPDGSAVSANVVADPGHGFGRAARVCALARRYNPALDKTGSPILSSAPVNVRFNR